MKIPLNRGLFVTVDDDAGPEITSHKWSTNGAGYAQRRSGLSVVLMHRAITHAPHGVQVDHINGDTLDNRRVNLRLCTHAQNGMNQRKRPGMSSPYKGVSYEQRRRKWRAHIQGGGRDIYIGMFATQEEAAAAYNAAATKYFGEFAKLNDITGGQS